MIPDLLGQQLHDRASRGLTLSAEEQAQLALWYTACDRAEAGALAPDRSPPALAELRTQLNSAVNQVVAVTQRVQELTKANDTLRLEIDSLQTQLKATKQPA